VLATKQDLSPINVASGPDSDMLDLIYEGAFETRPWQAFVDKLRDVTNATRVSIQLYRPEDAEHDIRVVASTHPGSKIDWRLLRDTYQQDYQASDPIRHFKLVPGQVVTLDDCRGSSFRDELLVPRGINHYIRASFFGSGEVSGWLQVIGHKPTTIFNMTKAVEVIKELLPHLDRALKLYSRILIGQSEKALYEKAISHLAFGAIVLDGKRKILNSNRIATHLLERYPEITVANNRLILSGNDANRELQEAITAAIEAKKQSDRQDYVELVRMRTSCGALIGFLILPTPSIMLYQGYHTPNVVIYVCDLEQHIGDQQERMQSAEQLVAKLFKLTKSEARLAVLLADGQTMSEAATDMGITEGSVRTYTKRIYEKTDIRRQSDLIRLIYRSVALLG
jgi:DNA-binding CsgD family transcriptional regulator